LQYINNPAAYYYNRFTFLSPLLFNSIRFICFNYSCWFTWLTLAVEVLGDDTELIFMTGCQTGNVMEGHSTIKWSKIKNKLITTWWQMTPSKYWIILNTMHYNTHQWRHNFQIQYKLPSLPPFQKERWCLTLPVIMYEYSWYISSQWASLQSTTE
jgi:hypothetical protein